MGVPDPSAPHILDEVEAVGSVLPDAEVFIGPEATHEVLRERGAHARYVHIATHGLFRQDNPMFSSISLGNSQLSLFDLYHLNLPSELVTLERLRHGAERGGGRRRADGAEARAAVRGRAGTAVDAVGRQRPEHGRVHEAVLFAAANRLQQGAGGSVCDERNSADVCAPVLLGAVRAGGEI